MKTNHPKSFVFLGTADKGGSRHVMWKNCLHVSQSTSRCEFVFSLHIEQLKKKHVIIIRKFRISKNDYIYHELILNVLITAELGTVLRPFFFFGVSDVAAAAGLCPCGLEPSLLLLFNDGRPRLPFGVVVVVSEDFFSNLLLLYWLGCFSCNNLSINSCWYSDLGKTNDIKLA